MAEKFRWGILGPGSIAKKFAEGLKSAAGAELIAVGSRSQERAIATEAFIEVELNVTVGAAEVQASTPG